MLDRQNKEAGKKCYTDRKDKQQDKCMYVRQIEERDRKTKNVIHI